MTLLMLQACGLQLLDPAARNNTSPAVPNPDDTTYTVGGTVVGLPMGKNVDVAINENAYTLDTNGTFTFPETFDFNQSYDVQVAQGPGGAYICSVDQGQGVVQNDVDNVLIECTCDVDSLGPGKGTQTDPYKVYTAEQFDAWAVAGNSPVNDAQHFLQVCELDFQNIDAPTPMGTRNQPFNGIYDGNEFFMINYTSDAQAPSSKGSGQTAKGIFGYTYDAFVTRVRLAQIYIQGSADLTNARVGGLIGQAGLTALEDIYATNIRLELDEGTYNGVGGLVGRQLYVVQTSATPEQRAARAIHLDQITIVRNHPTPQLVELSIDACNDGSIACNIGGVFGLVEGVTENIMARQVNMMGCDVNCGGLAGRYNELEDANGVLDVDMKDVTITDGYIDGGYIVGGLVGLHYAKAKRVSFDGTVYASRTGSGCVGGLIGYATPAKGTLEDAYVSADIQALIANPLEVGFVAGHLMETLNVSYDANRTCTFCEVINDVSSQANVAAFYDATDSAMQSWDTQNTWCLLANDFAQLREVPFSSCE
jgi:hypothetical protein